MASNIPTVPNDIDDPVILRRFLLDLVKSLNTKPTSLSIEASPTYNQDDLNKIITKINEILI